MYSVTIRFCWTAEDLFTASRYSAKSKWPGIFFISGMIALCCWILLKSPSPGRQYNLTANLVTIGILAFATIVGMAVIVIVRKIHAIFIRREFAKRPDSGKEMEWTLSETGIITKTEDSRSEFGWTTIQKMISTPVGFLFYPNLRFLYFIPHRAFACRADIDSVKALARAHVVDFKEVG